MKLTVMFILLFLTFSQGEEIDRSTRGLDTQGFRALIDIGKFISKFGVENFENDLKGAFKLISQNIFIFYFLLISVITSQLLTFTLTLFAIRGKKPKETMKYIVRDEEDISYDTNDRTYWPHEISV